MEVARQEQAAVEVVAAFQESAEEVGVEAAASKTSGLRPDLMGFNDKAGRLRPALLCVFDAVDRSY